jgi:hypothetical protein
VDNIRQSAPRNPLHSFPASIPSPAHQLEYSISETPDEDYVQSVRISKNAESRLGGFLGNRHATYLTDGADHETLGSSMRNTKPNPFLPPTSDRVPEIMVGADVERSQISSLLELLKTAISLISNQNPEAQETCLAVIRLFQGPRNLSLLRYLLEQKLPSVDAFAEKLLAPAVLAGNTGLVTMLINNGVPVDSRSSTAITLEQFSGLEAAIMSGREHMVRYLLDHGADPHLPSWKSQPVENTSASSKKFSVLGRSFSDPLRSSPFRRSARL